MNDKKQAQKVWSNDLVHEKPFIYRVVPQKIQCTVLNKVY